MCARRQEPIKKLSSMEILAQLISVMWRHYEISKMSAGVGGMKVFNQHCPARLSISFTAYKASLKYQSLYWRSVTAGMWRSRIAKIASNNYIAKSEYQREGDDGDKWGHGRWLPSVAAVINS